MKYLLLPLALLTLLGASIGAYAQTGRPSRPYTGQNTKPRYTPPPTRPYTPAKPKPIRLGYHQGDNLVSVGIGLASYYGYGTPIGASYEAGIDKDFSVGAQIDYNAGNYGDYYYNNYQWRYTSTYIGVRGSYHVNRILNLNTQKVDLYAGAGLGYRSFRWNDSRYGYGYDYSSGLFVNYFLGGKYYFTPTVGAFLELGYSGLSPSRIGLAVKF
ncbi:hypothetical protein GCM10028805_37750 [Spirosoma harenae]